MPPLSFTGEQITPEIRGEDFCEHLHRYALAYQFAAGKDVLDVASGEGYGSFLLSKAARSVKGLDYLEHVVSHSQATYPKDNLVFQQGDARRLPYPDASFDMVVSFETLEHIDPPAALIREMVRVLRADGYVFLSTPERKGAAEEKPLNPFHCVEYSREELKSLLHAHFPEVSIYLQKSASGSCIFSSEKGSETPPLSFSGDIDHLAVASGLQEHEYLIAVCGKANIPTLPASLFENPHHFHAFQDLLQDRKKAQQIMEEQHAIILHKEAEIKKLQTIPNPFLPIYRLFKKNKA